MNVFVFLSTHSFAGSYTHTDISPIDLSTQLYIEQSKAILSSMSSRAVVAKMTATGRLHCDVFGALSSSKTGNRKKSSTKDKRVTASMIETNTRLVLTRSLSINGDDWLSDTASLEDLFEEAGRDSVIPRNRRASLANDSRSSSMVLSSRDSSGKRQQEMIDLLLDLDPA